MSYSSVADIKARVPELLLIEMTQADSSSGTPDDVKIQTAIDDADELIDFYLEQKYELPFSEVPGIVKQLSIDITRYNLYKYKYDVQYPEPVVEVYNRAIKLLEKLRNGEEVITGATKQDDKSGTFTVVTNMDDDDMIYDDETLDMI